MKSPGAQRGVALVIALLAVALALVLIASLLDRGELAYARTRNVVRGEQAAAYAEGLEAFAAQVLMRDRDANPNLDTLGEPWALPLPAQPVAGGQISAAMRDLNGCFNLNNLIDDTGGVWRKRLRNLLATLQLDPALGGAIVDWLDGDAAPIWRRQYRIVPATARLPMSPSCDWCAAWTATATRGWPPRSVPCRWVHPSISTPHRSRC